MIMYVFSFLFIIFTLPIFTACQLNTGISLISSEDNSSITNPSPDAVSNLSAEAYTNSLSSISQISWSYSGTNNDSSLAYFEYCLGSTNGECELVNWTSNSSSSSLTLSGLSLSVGTRYYLSVRAVDLNGNKSQIQTTSTKILPGVTVSPTYATVLPK